MKVKITKGRNIPNRPAVRAGQTLDLPDDLAGALIGQGCAVVEAEDSGGSVIEVETDVAEPVADIHIVEEEE